MSIACFQATEWICQFGWEHLGGPPEVIMVLQKHLVGCKENFQNWTGKIILGKAS